MQRLTITTMLVFAVLAGCGSGKSDGMSLVDTSGSRASRGSSRKLRVSLQDHLSQAPIMIADAEGYFRDEGLDIEFVPAMRPQETLVALVTGDIDVRPGPMSASFLSAIAQKAPIRAVADEGYLPAGGCMYFGIVLRKGLDTAGSPRIKRMRTGQDGVGRFLTEQLLGKRKISIESVESVSLPEVMMAGSLEDGAIDAISTTEPNLSRLVKVGQRWLGGQEATPDMQWGVISFSERMLNADREAGVRFLRAYRRGVAQYNTGKTPRNIAIIAKATGDPEDVIRDACWPSFRADSRINWTTVEAFQAWALANKLMETTVTQSQVWDSSFLVASDSARK